MNVHKIHGNTPIEGKEGEYERLSFVSYLRENIVEKTQGLSLLPLDYFANPEKYQKGNYFEKKTRKTTKSKKVAKTKKRKTKKNKKANNSNNVRFNLL